MIFPDDLSIGEPKRVRLPLVLTLLLAGSVLAGCGTTSEEAVLEEQDLSVSSIVHPEDADPDTIILAERALADGSNTMPTLIAAARAGATLGEMSNRMRSQFGEFREPSPW